MDKIACAWAIFNNGVRLQKKEGVCVETVSFYCISRGRSKWRTRPQATPNKNNQALILVEVFGNRISLLIRQDKKERPLRVEPVLRMWMITEKR